MYIYNIRSLDFLSGRSDHFMIHTKYLLFCVLHLEHFREAPFTSFMLSM
jgi:hypothetical protein